MEEEEEEDVLVYVSYLPNKTTSSVHNELISD